MEQILVDAYRQECTDVHISTVDDNLMVQFRVNGVLVPYLRSKQNPMALVRRIKSLARMDIAEHRVPQNGTFQTAVEDEPISVRVAALPTATGQSVVLRILSRQRMNLSLHDLGMTEQQVETAVSLLQGPPGLILIAGPTGSGKTTTMYAMLRAVAAHGNCIVSVEDPVEMPSAEFSQLEVREDKGVTFANGLKALLRQDPDALMVGEIRDEQTAKIVLQAALTGHLILSTTHANDLAGAFARLTEFGLSRAMLAEVFRGVIIQHLPVGTALSRIDRATVQVPPGRFEIYPVNNDVYELLLSELPWPLVRQELYSLQRNVSEVRNLRRGG